MRITIILSIFLLMACSKILNNKSKRNLNLPNGQVDGQNQNKDDMEFSWLEEISSKKSLDWAKAENEKTFKALKNNQFDKLKIDLLDIYNDSDKLRYPSRVVKGKIYHHWQDSTNPQGLLLRQDKAKFDNGVNDWEEVLSIDDLPREGEINWVYEGMQVNPFNHESFLISLSKGGKDAKIIREFNPKTKTFIEDGFVTPEAKQDSVWIDKDTLFIGLALNEESKTKSGYPRLFKTWKRGEDLALAPVVFEIPKDHVAIWMATYKLPNHTVRNILYQYKTFYNVTPHLLTSTGEIKQIHMRESDEIAGFWKDDVLIHIKSDLEINGQVIKTGSIVSAPLNTLIQNKPYSPQVVWDATNSPIYSEMRISKNALWFLTLSHVSSRLYQVTKNAQGKIKKDLISLPKNGRISFSLTSSQMDGVYVTYQDFITPTSIHFIKDNRLINEIATSKSYFDSDLYKVSQYFATSNDGTKVPYYVVASKTMINNGENPTLLYGYGGFEISLRPRYSATIGRAWLENGGVYVLSNIRGGGEYGPAWHKAALKENRHKAYEDFFAIAEDLIAKKITSSKKLSAAGGSNGGLLMGVAYTQRPELFKAIVCQVPLLDMLRYHKLLAGASWMGEYGNPDIPKEREYLADYSPFHNIEKNKKYPEILLMTSTRDDRVHPGHARKMAARLSKMKHSYYYYENIEGGHGGSANNEQSAFANALEYTFLLDALK